MQAVTDVGKLTRREVDALLLSFGAGMLVVRAHLLAVSALTHRLELLSHRFDGAGEIGQLTGDAGDVLFGRHDAGFYAGTYAAKGTDRVVPLAA